MVKKESEHRVSLQKERKNNDAVEALLAQFLPQELMEDFRGVDGSLTEEVKTRLHTQTLHLLRKLGHIQVCLTMLALCLQWLAQRISCLCLWLLMTLCLASHTLKKTRRAEKKRDLFL